MATQEDLIISIQADSAKAVAGLNNVQSELKSLNEALAKTAKATEKTQKATTDWGAAALKLQAAMSIAATAVNALSRAVGGTVDQFVESDAAINKLRNTLRLVGTKDLNTAVSGFQDFATELQRTTVVGDDMAIEMIAMAKALRLTDDQAKALVTTAADLSAVTGKDMKASFDSLLGSFKGEAGELAKLAPQLKGLTQAQLQQGDAVKVLGEKFAGFAKAQAQTIGGQLAQVRNLYGDTLEDIGGLFSEFFRMDDQRLAMDALNAVRDGIAAIKPVVIGIRDDMVDFAKRVQAGFTSIQDKSELVVAALVPIGAAIAVAFGPAAIASVAGMAAAFTAMAIPAALVAAKVLLITAAITGVAAAVDIMITNFDRAWNVVKKFFEGIGKAATATSKALAEAFRPENIFSFLTDKSYFNNWTKDLKSELADAFTATGIAADDAINNIDFGIAGKAIKGLKDFMAGFNKEVEVATKVQTQFAGAVAGSQSAFTGLSKEGQAAFDNLMKKIDELRTKQAQGSQNQVALIEAQAVAEQKNIDMLQKQLEAVGALNAKSREQLEIARQLVQSNKQVEIANAQKKALDEILEKNKDLEVQVKSIGATQQDIITFQLARQLELIEKKREELRIAGLLTDEANKALDAQASQTKQGASKSAAKAPAGITEELTNIGVDMGKGITDAFAPMLGAIGGVNAYVAAAQAVVDAIPQMLSNVTNLINSITELPLKILDGFGKLFDAIIKLITDLPKNLINMITGLLRKFGDFLKELPKAIVGFFKELPKLLMGLLDELPKIMEGIIQSLVEMGPQIAMSIIEWMVVGAPKVALKLVEYLAIKLPIALIKGLAKGVENVVKMLKNAFSGKGFNLVDGKKIEQQLKETFKKVSGSASRLFQVSDIADAAQAADKAQEMIDGINKAGQRFVDMLIDAWRWVYDSIIKPIIDALTKVWRWVWDNVLKPIVDLVQRAWRWVWDNVIQPILSIVQRAWQWVWDNVIKPITNVIQQAWKWVWDSVIAPIANAIKTAWQWVWDNVSKPFIDMMAKMWSGIFDAAKAVFNFIGQSLNAVWENAKAVFNIIVMAFKASWELLKTTWDAIFNVLKSVWDGLMTVLKSAWSSITSIFTNLWEGVKKIWSTLMDMFSGKIGLFEGISKIFATVFDTAKKNFEVVFKFFQTVGESISKVFTTAIDGLNKVWKTFTDKAGEIGSAIWDAIKAAWEKGKSIFGDAGKAIFDAIKKGLDGIGDFFKGLGGKIWDGLKDGLSNIGNILGRAFDALNPANLFEKIFRIDFGGKGTVEKTLGIDVPFANFAKGGLVPGNPLVAGDSLLNDKVVALLSPGEAVIPRTKMQDPTIRALVMAIQDGLIKPQKHGWGVANVVSAVTGGGGDPQKGLGAEVSGQIGGVAGDILGGNYGAAWDKISNLNPTQIGKELENGWETLDKWGQALDPSNMWKRVKKEFFDNFMQVFEFNKFAAGGLVGDTVPAMLTPGEFVMSRNGVASAGLDTLNSINRGGGAGGSQVITYNIEMPVTIKNDGMPVDANFVRQRLMPTIEAELKRSSIEGKFVISQRGVR